MSLKDEIELFKAEIDALFAKPSNPAPGLAFGPRLEALEKRMSELSDEMEVVKADVAEAAKIVKSVFDGIPAAVSAAVTTALGNAGTDQATAVVALKAIDDSIKTIVAEGQQALATVGGGTVAADPAADPATGASDATGNV